MLQIDCFLFCQCELTVVDLREDRAEGVDDLVVGAAKVGLRIAASDRELRLCALVHEEPALHAHLPDLWLARGNIAS
jgi:hypothetical protein